MGLVVRGDHNAFGIADGIGIDRAGCTTVTPANSPDQWRLSHINHRLEQLESQSAELEQQRASAAKQSAAAARRLRYLNLARSLRAPAAHYDLWRTGVLVVGPLFAGFLLLILVQLITGWLGLGFMAFLVGALAGAGLLASLFYRPPEALLASAIEQGSAERRLAENQLKDFSERLAAAKSEQAALLEESRALMASGQVQRAALLQREWKTMAEVEWEDFVVEVCRTLGIEVERLSHSASQDADLLARSQGVAVAVVTRGEGHVVNSSAVQHALAAKKARHTDRCAVIINRRFTGAAQDFARHNGCTVIGLEEFPDFVMGRLTL
jgi:HJR/Mrr/RecB family endonuclease